MTRRMAISSDLVIRVFPASLFRFDLSSPNKKGVWNGKSWQEPISQGREFTAKEIWDNDTRFIKQVAPVAEEAYDEKSRRSGLAG
jgi:hypothetical protein